MEGLCHPGKQTGYCNTLIFCGYLIWGIFAVKAKSENISPSVLYAELNRGADKNGEPGEYLRYFFNYP